MQPASKRLQIVESNHDRVDAGYHRRSGLVSEYYYTFRKKVRVSDVYPNGIEVGSARGSGGLEGSKKLPICFREANMFRQINSLVSREYGRFFTRTCGEKEWKTSAHRTLLKPRVFHPVEMTVCVNVEGGGEKCVPVCGYNIVFGN